MRKDVSMELDISGIAYDSRAVQDGYLFVAIPGEKYDGHDFIEDVFKKGAIVVVGERDAGEKVSDTYYIQVQNSRRALACIAHNFYKMPPNNLVLIGITGTNGKTTTTYILKTILESWGKDVGLIGTIQYMIKDKVYPALHTTPESPEFHGLLHDMFEEGCSHVISEVSSHALAQYRTDGVLFDVAVFTNLTRDHLDFHQTMEQYFRAKERLFRDLLNSEGVAIINLDDQFGKRLASSFLDRRSSQTLLTYGLTEEVDIRATDIENSFDRLRFYIRSHGEKNNISTPLIGLPNVYNILSAVSVARSLEVPWQAIREGVETIGNIPGRFEKVEMGQGFLCIVDYAHTEDALERLLRSARALITHNPLRRLITVFGCGGDRDHGKRPGMGEIATRLSDFVIITSDNPRTENPLDIIRDIESGVERKSYLIEPDRREAIRKAVVMALNSDIVLIAGKGHEEYQEIHGVRYQFNDKNVLQEAIRNKLGIRSAK